MDLRNYGTLPDDIPVIVEDELFLYPFMISPMFLEDEDNLRAVEHSMENNSLILVVPALDGKEGRRDFKSIYKAGVIGTIMRKISLQEGKVKILFQGLEKGAILKEVSSSPLIANVDTIKIEDVKSLKIDAILEVVREKVRQLAGISNYFQPELLKTIDDSTDTVRVADLICSSIRIKKKDAFSIFTETDIEKKFLKIMDFLISEIESSRLQKEIRGKVHNKIEKINKEYFLKEQAKQIQKELGVDAQRDEEIEEYRKRLELKKSHMGEDAYKELNKQLERFARIHPDGSDASVLQGYLEWALDIPFGDYSKGRLDIKSVENSLNKDHFGLVKPKNRIVEYFAVKELLNLRGVDKKQSKGVIICLVGPPGVGKTSLANSISKALKRPLIRVALGGMEDVNELRGHRRTYVGCDAW